MTDLDKRERESESKSREIMRSVLLDDGEEEEDIKINFLQSIAHFYTGWGGVPTALWLKCGIVGS